MTVFLAAAAAAIAPAADFRKSEVCVVYFEPRFEVVSLSGPSTSSVVTFATPPRGRNGIVYGEGWVAYGCEREGVWVWSRGSASSLIRESGAVVGRLEARVVVRAPGGELIGARSSGSRAGSPSLGQLRYLVSESNETIWSWYELGTGIVLEGGGRHSILGTGAASLYRVERLGPGRFFAVARFGGQVQVWLVGGSTARRLWMSAPDRGDAFVDRAGNIVVLRYVESGLGVETAVSRISAEGKARRIALLRGEFVGVDLDTSNRYLWAVRLDRSHGGNPLVRVELGTGHTTAIRDWVDTAFVFRDEGGWIFE
jgi:hypothetical protein